MSASPGSSPQQVVTNLLVEWKQGNKAAMDLLTPLVYNELRRLAERYLRNERSAATLQPTALVHEAYLRLVAQSMPDWESRAHFPGAMGCSGGRECGGRDALQAHRAGTAVGANGMAAPPMGDGAPPVRATAVSVGADEGGGRPHRLASCRAVFLAARGHRGTRTNLATISETHMGS